MFPLRNRRAAVCRGFRRAISVIARRGAQACMLSFLMLSCGCQNMWPNLFQPGTGPMQRSRAALHDPYPDPNLAPIVEGGRPREYQVPYPEAVKNRSFADRYVP